MNKIILFNLELQTLEIFINFQICNHIKKFILLGLNMFKKINISLNYIFLSILNFFHNLLIQNKSNQLNNYKKKN